MTVWFQNRRQLSKKQTLILGSTPQPMCRQPLRTTSNPNSQATSRQASVSSTSQSSAPQTPLFHPTSRQQSRRLELWEHLPSSPVTSNATVSAATSAMPSPLAKKFPNIFGVSSREDYKENGGNKKRKPILEWACARVAKRQRMQAIAEEEEETEDESDVDVTLVDIENVDPNPKFDKGKRTDVVIGRKLAMLAPKPATVSIPPEFTKSFDPDIVFGASLLLTFKNSRKTKS